MAIATKRALCNIEPFGHFDIPAAWTRTYPKTAKGVPAAESLTSATAADVVASFIDPALDMSSNPATWGLQTLAWVPATSGPTAPANA